MDVPKKAVVFALERVQLGRTRGGGVNGLQTLQLYVSEVCYSFQFSNNMKMLANLTEKSPQTVNPFR